NEKFEEDRVNVLIVVPEFRTPLFRARNQLVQAFIGQPVLTWKVDVTTGAAVDDGETVFRPDGELVRRRKKTAAGMIPQFTRVSAIVSLEPVVAEQEHESRFSAEQIQEAIKRKDHRVLGEMMWEFFAGQRREDHAVWVEHKILVVHNPHARKVLDE